MSREERRQYQRMMRNMERGPALPPAARARAERNAARRERIRGRGSTAGGLTRSFWVRSVAIALILGFVAFSLQWAEGMPFALYVGLAVSAVVLVLAAGFRFLQSRAAAR
ncbi:MAG TPA: hypothetical protein VFV59_10255 [Candidatus Limnocylindria bacterium]|nr:hypothetical protein [Candidatus Limnocylindria bacterium]